MARTSFETGKTPFLPQGVSAFLRRRAVEAFGLAVIAAGGALLAAITSYSPRDASLNTAVDGPVANWLGAPGAMIADIGLQSIGLAALLPGLVLVAWGFRIIVGKDFGALWLRVALLPVALLLCATGVAGIAPPDGWSLRSGLGGYLGHFVLSEIAALLGGHGITAPILVVSLPILVLGLGVLFYVLGFSYSEWRTGSRVAWRGAKAGGRIAGRGAAAGLNAGRDIGATVQRGWAARKTRIEPRMPDIAKKETAAPANDGPPVEAPKPQMPPAAATAAANDLVAPRAEPARPGRKARAARQTTLNLVRDGDYALPTLDLLDQGSGGSSSMDQSRESLEANARLLKGVLEDFGIQGEILKVRPGPVVTLYELEPAPGIKSSRVIGLADDIARSMSAISVRIAVVPGRNVIGIELPNARREMVYLRELLASEGYERTSSKLTLVLGKDISGAPVMADLARMPHLLIAGTTGSGKSVAINTMILSLLYRLTPEECRFIMIDPKMLELSVYDDIPHLLTPVVTEPGKAVMALRWTVKEMEHRYSAMSHLGVRNISSFNQRLAELRRKGKPLVRPVQTGYDPETGKPIVEEQELDLKPLPLIVVVVDEMADLMLVAGKEIEGAVQRLSQMARAAGIHIIMATQRPSVDVITGTIKANFPTRISFQVTSKVDSRTILGEAGAEQLLGQGDMLYMAGGGRLTRIHGPFVSDAEVERVVNALRDQGEPEYVDEVTEEEAAGFGGPGPDSGDALYDQAVSLVLRERRASTSFIQRHLQIGYNRAARIMDQMEAEGVVSQANHAGKREVLPGSGA
ncbi:MAG TPA: DNA translocase FtsK 4TM domain-containing protein [Alphaproteobacteria bacterium]|nr:DNA translocase FtsK 4TM domain-containing protein [Alphaproteobacteria bacterium]